MSVAKGPSAEVVLTAKVLGKDGRVLSSKIFVQEAGFTELNPATAAAAINEAFGDGAERFE